MTKNDSSRFRSEVVDDLPALVVAPGVVRRQLLTTEFARGWVVDFAPGSEWPETDVHDAEERYFVLSGEIIEGEQRYLHTPSGDALAGFAHSYVSWALEAFVDRSVWPPSS
ncbi:MAG: hypothetical protein ACRD0R_03325 [Acidimicrobiales bacterium]